MSPSPGGAPVLARPVGADYQPYDYTASPYPPVSDPTRKWSSGFVLEEMLDASHADQGLRAAIAAACEEVGFDATVWGVKRDEHGYGWELYFYDYSRADPRFSVQRVMTALGAPPVERHGPELEALPRRFFMYSVDLVPGRASGLEDLHLYFYDVGERASGLSYRYDPPGWTLENHYSFYDAGTEVAMLREKVLDSPRLAAGTPVARLLPADLLACRRVCVANKPSCDGLYFSGVSIDAFVGFIESFDYDRTFVASVRQNATLLDHLLYDVAFDYRTSADGMVEIVKTGFYGTA